jgi:hypothetical protein
VADYPELQHGKRQNALALVAMLEENVVLRLKLVNKEAGTIL